MQIGRCEALQELVGRTEIGLRLTGKPTITSIPIKASGIRRRTASIRSANFAVV